MGCRVRAHAGVDVRSRAQLRRRSTPALHGAQDRRPPALLSRVRAARHIRRRIRRARVSRPFDELVARARAVAADLYVAHNAEALPAAHAAARARGAGSAFDSEDLHTGEQGDGGAGDLRAELLDYFERRCLPACRYVTVPSQPIADELVERYGIARPVTVHNVFPLTDRARLDGQRRDRRSRALSLYWYSQVVGLERGLQDAVHALGRVRGSVELHVRGKLAPNVERELRRLAREHRVEGQLIFHATVHPDELLARTAEHDIGLALEQPVSRNRLLTVTNKCSSTCWQGLDYARPRHRGRTQS